MKLLVVEDEIKTGDYVRQGLVESGFVVDLARTGLDGHHLALTGSYDLVILDVMLFLYVSVIIPTGLISRICQRQLL